MVTLIILVVFYLFHNHILLHKRFVSIEYLFFFKTIFYNYILFFFCRFSREYLDLRFFYFIFLPCACRIIRNGIVCDNNNNIVVTAYYYIPVNTFRCERWTKLVFIAAAQSSLPTVDINNTKSLVLEKLF